MNLLILGANSDVAHALAKIFAKTENANIYLASRNMELLNKKALDIKARYDVDATAIAFNATDYDTHQTFYDNLSPKPDGVFLAFGYLGDQIAAQENFSNAREIIESNYMGAVSILEIIAKDFERRSTGFIIGISSVAGDRGRQSNYIYGSAKSGVAVYLAGLRNRLHKSNVPVITVLPGFIRTKMTEDLDLPKKLMADPDEVAVDIYRAYTKNKEIIYTKWFWKYIMFIIRNIPEKIFKRMNL